MFLAIAVCEACLWADYTNHLQFTVDQAATFDRTFALLDSSIWPVFGACAVMTVLLTYRVFANAHARGADKRLTGPVLAAGSYFMPFLGLFLPPLMMGKLWRETFGENGAKPSGIIGFWWFALIFGGFTGVLVLNANAAPGEEHRWFLLATVSFLLRAAAAASLRWCSRQSSNVSERRRSASSAGQQAPFRSC